MRLRSRFSARLPRALVPYGRRAMRRFDQMLGSGSSARRPGVVMMLHVGRCGSTVLAGLLAQNPGIYWDAKLHRKARGLYGDGVRELDPAEWTRRQFPISGARYYGFEFKILPDQYAALLGTTPRRFLDQCRAIGVTHYILLTRRNTLRHVVSHYASRDRGSWHRSDAGSVRQQRFALDVLDITTGSAPGRPLVRYLQEVEDAHEEVRQILRDEKLLEIGYEEDIAARGPEFAYAKACVFLDVEPGKVTVRNRRLNPFPMSSTLLNHDDIVRSLTGTPFEWMLEAEEEPGDDRADPGR